MDARSLHIIGILTSWRLRDMIFPYFLLKKSLFQGALKNFNPFDLWTTFWGNNMLEIMSYLVVNGR